MVGDEQLECTRIPLIEEIDVVGVDEGQLLICSSY